MEKGKYRIDGQQDVIDDLKSEDSIEDTKNKKVESIIPWRTVLEKMLNWTIEFAKRDYQKTCVLLASAITVSTGYIKLLFYCYFSGCLSVYGINYINIKVGDGTLNLLFMYVAATILIFFSNLFSAMLIKDKKYIKLIELWLFETLIILFFVSIAYIDFSILMKQIREIGYSSTVIPLLKLYGKIFFMLILPIHLFLIILIGFIKTGKGLKTKEQNLSEYIKKQLLVSAGVFLLCCSAYVLLVYLFGVSDENKRENYSIIINENSDKFDAIVYETDENYLVCPVDERNGKIEIRKNASKIIQKTGVWTYQIKDLKKKSIVDIYDEIGL